MKKILLLVLMSACVVSGMDAAGSRGRNAYRGRGGSGNGGSYTHSVGGVVGNMFGGSYKGFVLGVDGLALQMDLAVKMQRSPAQNDIKLKDQELHNSFNWSNFTFELNPNIVYQKELGSAGRSTFAMYGGGGVSLGMVQSLNLASLGVGTKNSAWGKFGMNGIVGMEFVWSRFVLSLDARPGYGMAFSSKYEYRGGMIGENAIAVDTDRCLRHFFDFGATIGMRYCF